MTQELKNTPLCPVCGGHHYPAINGNGKLVHCNGQPVTTPELDAPTDDFQHCSPDAPKRASVRDLCDPAYHPRPKQ